MTDIAEAADLQVEAESEDNIADIAAKKNRERFAIKKSYSIEVSYS